ncbi:MAG: hypothetical protein CMJ78_09435, partial [Planctomycetaceae bacterium]|nr:hypothetical protein [Planctomycetaceae bacterium]
ISTAAMSVGQQRSAMADEKKSEVVKRGIAELRLRSSQMDKLGRFYGETLGLPTTMEADSLVVTAGQTLIRFAPASTNENDGPFYHFSFNIPENKLELGRAWQKKRTPLVKRGNPEVIHFSRWNAHSVFFNDPAGNILEYIAQHDLKNSAPGAFTTKDILYASEIGLVVDDVGSTVTAAKDSLGIGVYRDKAEFFASLGDEHALLMLVKRNRL